MTPGKPSQPPWYRNYEALRDEVLALRQSYHARCHQLGATPEHVTRAAWRELIALSVHESNWQEGIYLNVGRTRELAEFAFDSLPPVSGPHLNMDFLADAHRQDVLTLKRSGTSPEELAAFNLSRAHAVLDAVAEEFSARYTAALVHLVQDLRVDDKTPAEAAPALKRGLEAATRALTASAPVHALLTAPIKTSGELVKTLLSTDFDALLHPLTTSHLNFLHRVLMVGALPPTKCGHFRKGPVHVGNPDLIFPQAALLPELMEEFRREFPAIAPGAVKYDPIATAAKVSYRFVRIHPYADGNGRMSRLLMNLVLWGHHPPTFIKADKKGRHRYKQALRRADRSGDTLPLACLIAISLKNTYTMLIDSVSIPKIMG
jgi:fido (protein-threonine AMPylation protein)